MLTHLRIVDFAIIEEVEISPGPGLNIITGETGAGKSIIVSAVGLLRGGRATPDVVRHGCKEAVVEALFDLQLCPELLERVEQAGLPLSGKELLIRRVIPRSGRGRVYLNGGLCTLSVLSAVTAKLLDISGQHEHQLLSDRATHRQVLDALGTPAQTSAAMAQAFTELRRVATALEQSQMDERQRSSQIEFLRYQLRELEDAALSPGEDIDLERECVRLRRAAELLEVAVAGEGELYSTAGSVCDRLSRLGKRLAAVVAIDARLESLSGQLDEARVLIEDVAQGLRHFESDVELDPGRLDQLEQRLDLIQRLKRKHGSSVAEILENQQEIQRELLQLENLAQQRDDLERELKAARGEAEHAATRLSAAREQAARKLSIEVTEQLAGLRMEGARLTVKVAERVSQAGDPLPQVFGNRKLSKHGWDLVEFHIATNPGEQALPLGRIASGGELSRVMLALRKVLGNHDPVRTSIYDEVDAGISGAVADVVGRNLAQIGRQRQVLCVTHLPQVAAHADAHFHVGKSKRRGRTRTLAKALTSTERVGELARLLGGERVTDSARANAKQLLTAAHSK